jgi:hypothetical protein
VSEALDLIYDFLDVFSGKKQPGQKTKEAAHGLQTFLPDCQAEGPENNQPGTLRSGLGQGAKAAGHKAAGVGPERT